MTYMTDSQTSLDPIEGCDRCTCGAKYYDQLKSGLWMCASCKDEIVVVFASIYDTGEDADWIYHDNFEDARRVAQEWSGADWYHDSASAIVAGESDAQRCWTGVLRVVVPSEAINDEDYNVVWDASEWVWEDNITYVSEVTAPSLSAI